MRDDPSYLDIVFYCLIGLVVEGQGKVRDGIPSCCWFIERWMRLKSQKSRTVALFSFRRVSWRERTALVLSSQKVRALCTQRSNPVTPRLTG